MEISFHGAVGQVTGSMFLLEQNDNTRILIDCGLDMENRVAGPRVPEFPCDPKDINAVLLTHAHLDHSGNLPNLVKEGFEGEIYCTYATYQLTEILLFDAARLNQRKLESLMMKSSKKRRGSLKQYKKEFYTINDVRICLERFHPVDFHEWIDFGDDISVYFNTAGHLLGAANIVIKDHQKTVIFSGDVGRKGYPLLKDPESLPQADAIVCETTYGNRVHNDIGDPRVVIERIITESCIDVPGRLIIPAFSIGRTQTLLFLLNQLKLSGRLPDIKVFTDSPLARRSTGIYEFFHEFLNEDARSFYEEHSELFDFDNLIYLGDLNSAEEIKNYNEPCIVISSSGMGSGGKIEDHLLLNLGNPYCTFLFVGYCAEGTLGHKLLTGKKTVHLKGEEIEISARIESTDVLSAHADHYELIDFLGTQEPEQTGAVYLVHGEPASMESFAKDLEKTGYQRVIIPEKGKKYPV